MNTTYGRITKNISQDTTKNQKVRKKARGLTSECMKKLDEFPKFFNIVHKFI